jgi:phage-related protein
MQGVPHAEIPVVFYQTSGGASPVLEWLRSLPRNDRRAIGVDLATVQFGWPLGMPLCRPLGQGLFEVRSALPIRRIARLLFFAEKDRIGIVHGFIKQTEKTPAAELELAKRRMKEMLS